MIVSVTAQNVSDAGLVHSKLWQASHKNLVSHEFLASHTPQRQTDFLKQEIANGKRLYIYYHKYVPAGIISLDYSSGEIGLLYVVPECWGNGYGRKLLDFGIQTFGKDVQPFLVVLNVNTRARKIYEKYGFVYCGEKRTLSLEKGVSELKYIYRRF